MRIANLNAGSTVSGHQPGKSVLPALACPRQRSIPSLCRAPSCDSAQDETDSLLLNTEQQGYYATCSGRSLHTARLCPCGYGFTPLPPPPLASPRTSLLDQPLQDIARPRKRHPLSRRTAMAPPASCDAGPRIANRGFSAVIAQ